MQNTEVKISSSTKDCFNDIRKEESHEIRDHLEFQLKGFLFCFVLGLCLVTLIGYSWLCTKELLLELHRNYSRGCSEDHMGCQICNLRWLHARQMYCHYTIVPVPKVLKKSPLDIFV